MNMNASESGLFKVLMWTITTLMGLVTLGVATILQVVVTIKIDFDKHAVAQDKQDNYYVNRLYNDSININTLFVSINELNQIIRLHAPDEYNQIKSSDDLFTKTKLEATLPKNKYKPKPLNQ